MSGIAEPPEATTGTDPDAAVPAFWRDLGLPGLIDVHVHFLPERMLRRVWAHFDSAGPLIGRPWPIRYRWPDARRMAHLAAMGVRAYPALAYAHRPGMAESLNEWTLGFAAGNPACLPSATFYPEPGVERYVSGALDAGARIFKVHLQVGGFDPRDPSLDPVWGLLAATATPVVVHAGSGPVAAGHTGPEPFAGVLRRHPGLVAVIAHLGAPEYEGFLDLAEKYPRVALDTTMAFTPFFERMAAFPRRALPRLHDLGMAGKVLLGSDFPNIPYPYANQLTALADLDLPAEWLRRVCWHNAAALLGPPAAGDALSTAVHS